MFFLGEGVSDFEMTFFFKMFFSEIFVINIMNVSSCIRIISACKKSNDKTEKSNDITE